jgi:hypothetical protein
VAYFCSGAHSIDVFEPLMLTFEALLNAGGMFYQRLPDGTYYVGLKRPQA